MGKIIVYMCDFCESTFKDPNQIIIINGKVFNGDEKKIYENNEKAVCSNCIKEVLFENNVCNYQNNGKIEIGDTDSEIKETKDIINYDDHVFLYKIENENEEQSLIEYLGHVSKDNFNKLYNKSLIGCYFPLDEKDTTLDFCKNRKIKIIYNVFAGVPQVREFDCITTIDEKYALILKSEMVE